MSSSLDYEKISVTAKFVAFLRTYSDIPYSQELSDKSNAKDAAMTIWKEDEPLMRYRAPQFEARYKLVTDIIEKLKFKQVLEIAAGLSVRGLVLTRNKDITYIETDLPGIIQEKEEIVKAILTNEDNASRPNLIFQVADAFNSEEVQNALDRFSQDEVAIVSEGLLTYLDLEELTRLSASIHDVLFKRTGVWITDIPVRAFRKAMAQEFGVDLNKSMKDYVATLSHAPDSLFETSGDVKIFFEAHGFRVTESHPYSEVIKNLTCVKKLDLDKEKVKRLLDTRSVFVLEAV